MHRGESGLCVYFYQRRTFSAGNLRPFHFTSWCLLWFASLLALGLSLSCLVIEQLTGPGRSACNLRRSWHSLPRGSNENSDECDLSTKGSLTVSCKRGRWPFLERSRETWAFCGPQTGGETWVSPFTSGRNAILYQLGILQWLAVGQQEKPKARGGFRYTWVVWDCWYLCQLGYI